MHDKIYSKTKKIIAVLCQKWQINKCVINSDSNDELKESDIKNCTCYHFDDIVEIKDFNLDIF